MYIESNVKSALIHRMRPNEQMMQSDYMVLSGFIDRPLLFTIYSNLVWHIIMSMPLDLCVDLRNQERYIECYL